MAEQLAGLTKNDNPTVAYKTVAQANANQTFKKQIQDITSVYNSLSMDEKMRSFIDVDDRWFRPMMNNAYIGHNAEGANAILNISQQTYKKAGSDLTNTVSSMLMTLLVLTID